MSYSLRSPDSISHFLGVIAAFAVLYLFRWYARSERSGQLSQQARDLGLTSNLRNGKGLPLANLRKFRLFGAAEHLPGDLIYEFQNQWENLMEGTVNGLKAIFFDYSRPGTLNSQTYTAAAFHTGKPLPAFEIFPKNAFREFILAEDMRTVLDFPGSSRFSDLYCVRVDDPESRVVFDSKILGLLETIPGWSIEASGNWMILYQRLVLLTDFPQFSQEASVIARMFADMAETLAPGSAAKWTKKVAKCRHCGAPQSVDSESIYCDQCGAPVAGAHSKTSSTPPIPDNRPTNGVCPKCGGPVVEVSPDVGVCTHCGKNLISIEARSRKRLGLFVALLAAALYAAYRGLFHY